MYRICYIYFQLFENWVFIFITDYQFKQNILNLLHNKYFLLKYLLIYLKCMLMWVFFVMQLRCPKNISVPYPAAHYNINKKRFRQTRTSYRYLL